MLIRSAVDNHVGSIPSGEKIKSEKGYLYFYKVHCFNFFGLTMCKTNKKNS
jgi:hypothetical protein